MTAEGAGAAATSSAIATASILAAPFTFGFSLTALPLAVAPIAAGPPTINNDKVSIKLTNEISESNSKLGKKFDYETEKYENKYLQEIPVKESCRIM